MYMNQDAIRLEKKKKKIKAKKKEEKHREILPGWMVMQINPN